MQILVNAVPMTGLLTGINRYLRNLYQALEELGEAEFFYITKRGLVTKIPAAAESHSWHKNTARLRQLPEPLILAGRSFNWFRHEYQVRRELARNDYTIYHETAFTPAAIKQIRPQIFTLHDLSLRHWRETHPKERVWFADIFMRRRLKQADHIITPSEFIRQELHQTMQIPLTKISVTYEAAANCFRVIEKEQSRALLNRFKLPTNYILFVGSLEPRKNIDTLIHALALTNSDIPLVLTGSAGWGEKNWLNKIKSKELAGRVQQTGHVSDSELVALYNRATAMVYPSLYEGFGLPIVEAMACGAPVITSRRASMPEVAGEAAILLDNPRDPEELAQAIDTIVQSSERQQELRRLGLMQAATFSWAKTAMATSCLFRKLAS